MTLDGKNLHNRCACGKGSTFQGRERTPKRPFRPLQTVLLINFGEIAMTLIHQTRRNVVLKPAPLASLIAALGALATGAAFADKSAAPEARKSETKQPQGGIAGLSCSCQFDLNSDGTINAADLAILLGGWGTSNNDLNGDGTVNGADLGIILGNWGACTAPSNDICANSISIPQASIGVAQAFCTTLATTSGPSVGGSCGPAATNIFKDVWFDYAPLGDGTLNLSTCAVADFDTIIAVYSSVIPGLNSCPPADGEIGTVSLVGCNDDAAGCPDNHSKLSVNVIGGRTYKIRVGGFGGASGSGALATDFDSVGDQCFDGIVVIGADNTTKTVKGTTVDNPMFQAPCVVSTSRGEWITYVPTCQDQNVHLSTCHAGTNFDTVVTVWRESFSKGCDAVLIECVDDTQSQSCLLDGVFRKSKVDFFAFAGETYHILVSGFNQSAAGNYELTIETDCFNP